MAFIPPGEFWQGSSREQQASAIRLDLSEDDPPYDPKSYSDEGPQHRVRITKPFWLGVHEVTQEQFLAMYGYNPSRFSAGGRMSAAVDGIETGRFPISCTWYQAADFCNRLSQMVHFPPYYEFRRRYENGAGWVVDGEVVVLGGAGYRLPTESEWEYACRAGTDTQWWFGDQPRGAEENLDYSGIRGVPKVAQLNRPCPVGQYPPNPFGLHDMHGNECEWCTDLANLEGYEDRKTAVVIDPITLDADVPAYRVVRGGCYGSHVTSRSATRHTTHAVYDDVGFRIARTIS